ncbi:hypothetical protein POTOM_056558 [Populus tomentosa]|uniref:ABC transmembrane type-1 domain-containing protein n=1 Tax=Populus tomentosa TaxID=118781 RepID=A0A8X7XZ92_POPTO|nr:hypothetical protein POTOM_056558 [Populus tomentosa]
MQNSSGTYAVMVQLQRTYMNDEVMLEDMDKEHGGASPLDDGTSQAEETPDKSLSGNSSFGMMTDQKQEDDYGYGLVPPLNPFFLGALLAVYFEDEHAQIRSQIRIYGFVFLAFPIFTLLANVIQHCYFGIMGETLTERFREAFFEKFLTFEIEWFDQENNSSGAICARLATDAVMMRTLVTDRLSLLTQAVSSATLAVVLAFMLSWRLALVAIALEPGVIAAIYLREMTMRIMSKKTLKAQSASSALASEVAGNHKIITAFGSQGKVVKLYDRSQVSSRKERKRQSWYAGTTNGGIEFKQVYFIYPARPKQIILRGLDLKIEASKIVALVGRSGSGKATTIRLIERFYDTLSGSIEVDGINIMCSNLRALRSHIALVSQEQTLFAGTRRDNIAYAKEKATEAEIIEAATIANAHGFISYMKDGYKTYCGERVVAASIISASVAFSFVYAMLSRIFPEKRVGS